MRLTCDSIGSFVRSSIGKKQIVALTGLGLSGFVLIHMSGNLLLFLGPEAYNEYSHKLTSNPLIYVAEVGLLALFFAHVWTAVQLSIENRRARPVTPYQLPTSEGRRASFNSRSMVYTGLLVLVFAVLHIWTFKYGTYYAVTYQGIEMRDLYRLVAEKFQEPLYLGWYLFSMVVLGIHLSHGFAATFQTLGFGSVRRPLVRQIGWVFALVVAGGFFSQPIYLFLSGGK